MLFLLDTNHFDKDSFWPLSIEFSIMNLLPSTEMQSAILNRHCDLLPQQLAFQMSISVIFACSMMLIFWALDTVFTMIGRVFLQPFHYVLVKPSFEIVHVTGSCNVHRVNQHESINDIAFCNDSFNLFSNAQYLVTFLCMYRDFFNVRAKLPYVSFAQSNTSLLIRKNFI